MNNRISKRSLYKATKPNLLRLANALGLRSEGMSHRQRARLVFWLITRRDKPTQSGWNW